MFYFVDLYATDLSASIYMISTHISKVAKPMKRTLTLQCDARTSMCERFCAEWGLVFKYGTSKVHNVDS